MRNQHIPFHQRNSQPIYIGFEKARPSNGFGIAGFVTSLLGICTFGLLSPLALLLSLIGLRKSPRGFALTGTLLGGLGTGFWALLFYAVLSAGHADRRHARIEKERRTTFEVIEKVNHDVNEFIIKNEGALPDAIEGNRFAVQQKDAWGLELQYAPSKKGFIISSAGPDQRFNTRDDLQKRYDYETQAPEKHYLTEL
jgi:hypothetical protein